MPFDPYVNQEIIIDGVRYQFREHPSAKKMPYGQEGRYGIVYQLQVKLPIWKRSQPTEHCALKVFKMRYRAPALAGMAGRMKDFASLPGLQVCRRSVLVPQSHADLLAAFPDLIYAVLMPWIDGPTWMQVMLEKRELHPESSLGIALALAQVLEGLEKRGMAHCDLSAPNVIVPGLADSGASTGGLAVALVDVEQLYAPNLPPPDFLPSNSPGYARQVDEAGVWSAAADRFAGAMLIAEMLAWCDARVREKAYGESYFEPGEMQYSSTRYDLLVHVLGDCWGGQTAGLFKRAWESRALADCPTFAEWRQVLAGEQEKIRAAQAQPPVPVPTSPPPTNPAQTVQPLAPTQVGPAPSARRPGCLAFSAVLAFIVVLGLGILIGMWLFTPGMPETPPAAVPTVVYEITSTPIPTQTILSLNTAAPTPEPTNPPYPTPTTEINTPTPEPTLTPTLNPTPYVYDNFKNPQFDGSFDTGRWVLEPMSKGDVQFQQADGMLSHASEGFTPPQILRANALPPLSSRESFFLETKMRIRKNPGQGYVTVGITVENVLAFTGKFTRQDNAPPYIYIDKTSTKDARKYHTEKQIEYDRWYTLRIEVDPRHNQVQFWIDKGDKSKPYYTYLLLAGESFSGSHQVFFEAQAIPPYITDIEYVRYGPLQ